MKFLNEIPQTLLNEIKAKYPQASFDHMGKPPTVDCKTRWLNDHIAIRGELDASIPRIMYVIDFSVS